MRNKVCIVGMGAISPIGKNVEDSFRAAVEGTCGIIGATLFDTGLTGIHVAGEVRDFDPSMYITKRESRRLARFTQFAIVAAMQAWDQSGMGNADFDASRVGVVLGSGMGGIDVICDQYDEMIQQGPRTVSPLFIPKAIINTAAGGIAIKLGLHGPCYSVVTACATGADAVGQAYYAVKEGRVDAVLVGGAEAAIIDLAVQGFHQMQALSESEDPKKSLSAF